MKIIVLLFAFIVSCPLLFSQTLFTYGNNAVGKEEFLRAYNKNKAVVTDKTQALKEYLDLFCKFKLKVKAAKDIRLDTLPQLVNDIQNFRAQVDESYMNNDIALNELIDEAFMHSQKDLHVFRFFIPLTDKSNNTDSAKAYAAMMQLYKELSAGKNDYNKLVADISSTYTNVKAVDIGYVSAFSIAYDYEKIIYNLKIGETSTPYYGKNGINIFKVLDERASSGKWKVAQILFAIPPGGDPAANTKLVQHKADSVYDLLKNGADFTTVANQFSDDKITYLAGGEMPEFSGGRYEMAFENEVFELKKDGDITRPFPTSFGFHIVKRLGVRPVSADKNDVSFRYEVKQKVMQDARISSIKDAFSKFVLKQITYKKNPVVKNEMLFRYADSVVKNPVAFENTTYPINNKMIFSFAKSVLTGKDWLIFIRDYKTNPDLYKGESYDALLQKFVTVKSMEYYRKHLEEYNDDFRFQMEEFKEGNLLFEIMERKVWVSAANDSVGLKKVYTENKSKYLWDASADVLIFSCSNNKSAAATLALLKNNVDWKKIAEESNNTVQSDSGRYELAQLSLPADFTPVAGMLTPITENTTDATAGFMKIIRLHKAKEQRSFEEAKGLVTNDYQNILEEKWITALKKKYPVKVDEKVFQSLLK
ncbi:MAG: peptidylprolyl isomerase [Ferruginibacter sp.]